MPEENPSGALSRRLEPLCPRHDHVMAYDGTGIRWREGRDRHSRLQTVSSYHCGYFGCSVRYTPEEGYFTVVDTPDRPHFVEEPGTNVFQCSQDGTWMYRARGQEGPLWRCGHSHDEKIAVWMAG
jgi:hypothetical protein